MSEETQDVNPSADSSTADATSGGQKQDVMEDSSSSNESHQTQDDKAQPSLLDAVKATLDKKGEKVSDVAELESGEDESVSETETDQKAEGKEVEAKGKKDDKEEEKVDGEEEAKDHEKEVPYERFQSVIAEKNELEQRVKRYEEVEVKNYKNITSFCEQFNISAAQHENAMRILALENTDPEKAIEELKKELETLQGYVGDKLPADLQTKVDEGKMEIEDAKEFARLRAKLSVNEKRQQNAKQSFEQQERARLERDLNKDSQNWVDGKVKNDPDFFPKKKESDVDGKFELVMDRYMSLLNRTAFVDGKSVYVNPVKSSQDMLALMERAYKEIDATYGRLVNGKKQPTRKPLTSSSSSSTRTNKTIAEAGSMAEAVQIGLRERGHKVV